jgi:hypothetical protein
MKRYTGAKLDKWFQAHAPEFMALDAPPRKVNVISWKIIPFNDLMRQFYATRQSGDREQAEAILDKVRVAFGAKRPQGKLERDVKIALLYLGEELNRDPTIREIFRMVHEWDKSYTERGVRRVIERRKLHYSIARRGPKKT